MLTRLKPVTTTYYGAGVGKTPVQKTSIILDQGLWREFRSKVARCGKSASKVLEKQIREYVQGPDDCGEDS